MVFFAFNVTPHKKVTGKQKNTCQMEKTLL